VAWTEPAASIALTKGEAAATMRDYSIPQRAEDRWEEMRKSAGEQRQLKHLGARDGPSGSSERIRVAGGMLRWLFNLMASLWSARKAPG
jgi:hypothetical protein